MRPLDFDAIGPKQTWNFTPYAYQELLSSPITCPGTEPGTPHVTHTIGSSDLSACTVGPTPSSIKYSIQFIVSGTATAGTNSTLNWRVRKNSISQSQTSGTATQNQNWSLRARLFDVALSDVIDVSCWVTSGSGCTITRKDFIIYPTRFLPVFGSGPALVKVTCRTSSSFSTGSVGSSAQNGNIYTSYSAPTSPTALSSTVGEYSYFLTPNGFSSYTNGIFSHFIASNDFLFLSTTSTIPRYFAASDVHGIEITSLPFVY